MWKYGLLFVFAIGCGQVVGQEDKCIFSCIDSNTVNYTGVQFSCGKDADGNALVCNPDCKAAEFCVLGSEACAYKCSDETTVEFKNMGSYKCPKNKICNQKYTSCDKPCVEEKCKNAKNYTCISDTSFKINILGVIGNCPTGQICNKASLVPTCDICIDEELIKVPSETLPTRTTEPSTTTAEPTTTTAEPPATTTELLTTTQPPTTTTNAPPSTILAPITSFPIPDCNNPPGYLMPCRVGPTGHYYKCHRVDSNSYHAQIMSCYSWKLDPICGRYRLC